MNHRPLFLMRFFQILAFVGAIPFLINIVDIVLHPFAAPIDIGDQRLILGLILAPFTLAIAILCVRHVPDNIIGWMLVAFAYGTSSLAMRRDMLPVTATVWIANGFITIFWLSYLLIPLYFPNGYLHPPRFNRWGNRIVALIVLMNILLPNLFNRNLSYGTDGNALQVPNPFFIAEFDYTIITIPVGIFGFIGLGSVTLLLRYRNGSALERLQMRWLLGGVIGQIGLVLGLSWIRSLGINTMVLTALYTIVIPFTIGIATLRHRLYDIDIIIRRTLIYAALTTILAAVYFGIVILVQQVFRALTGQSSDLAIVVSTLAIAALFTPLRRRIQNVIDRRLYRRKYDAAQTLEKFNRTLRDAVDLDTLKASLLGVVQETMQPTSVALWVQPTEKHAINEEVR
jgi:hypothetical protein